MTDGTRARLALLGSLAVAAVAALLLVVLASGVIEGTPLPSDVQAMIDEMKRDAENRTPEPCISFTPRGFVPCP